MGFSVHTVKVDDCKIGTTGDNSLAHDQPESSSTTSHYTYTSLQGEGRQCSSEWLLFGMFILAGIFKADLVVRTRSTAFVGTSGCSCCCCTGLVVFVFLFVSSYSR